VTREVPVRLDRHQASDLSRLGVLLIANEFPPEKTAGTAMSTQFLAEELAARGHQVTVVVNTRRTAPPYEASGDLRVLRLKPLGVPLTRMAQRAVQIARIARSVRPDIVQGQSLSCGSLAVVAGRAAGVPAVTYIQGLDLYEAGFLARRTYIRWTLNHSDGVAAVTDDLRSMALGLSGRQAEVIPHGLRLRDAHGLDRRTARAVLDLPADRPMVLYAGRLIPLKGVAYLLQALPRVLEACPDACGVIVGGGEERQNLLALARRLGLSDRAIFVGQKPHEDVIRYMRAADVFVLPSLIESFGIVLVEAMSCALPVVATNVMGIPSVVENDTNGYLVPPRDPQALADRITWLLTHPAERSEIARRNTQKAGAFAMPAIADRFLNLWRDLLASRVGGSRFLGHGDA
jgi:glycosyltransferase involved in cell wall biosynthesis